MAFLIGCQENLRLGKLTFKVTRMLRSFTRRQGKAVGKEEMSTESHGMKSGTHHWMAYQRGGGKKLSAKKEG